jgi:CTP:molybdopterin cytidylyltransferase MocA
MVPALILAAGRSTRMGRPKALLPCGPGGDPFIVQLAAGLMAGGAGRLLVVGREEDEPLRRLVQARLPDARFVVNRDPDGGGQLSSLLAGLDALDETMVTGVLVAPVDVPRVSAATVAALLGAAACRPGRIVRAVHGGRHGHPVYFPRELFDELRRADPRRGAKAVVRAHETAIVDVEVPDAGVVEDIDTPGDYARAFGS